MHQTISFVFIVRERTKDAILIASTLLQGLILEAGKRGGCKIFPSFNSSRNSSLYNRSYRQSALQDVLTYLLFLGNQVVLYCLEVLEVLGSLEDLGDLVSQDSLSDL